MSRRPLSLLARVSRRFRRRGHVTMERPVAVEAPQLGGRRLLTVYLPPDYEDVPGRSWPLLLAHDGQDMKAWKLRDALSRHHAAGGDTPVVATLGAGAERMQEYGTTGSANSDGQGKRAAEFQAFVTETVVPRLRRRYRLRPGAAHAAVMGASLGGLSAFDLAWHHPQVFGIAGAFSGSFWWRTDSSDVAAQQASRIMHGVVRAAVAVPALRLWFQAGTRDERSDRDRNGVIDAIQDTTELIDELVAKGFTRGHDVIYREVRGGEHNPATWARVLPEFLAWAFPAKNPHGKN